ncbi:MAG TPA: alpha-ketoacid dehydrogenase subunit beta [Deltaproteobacteria bacterium]|nr:MAG: 2-oxoisovalerate dehydrogenase [Deltaproteobacteria bacterium GWA2_55_82]OGQ64774.1 MAG: 2-oxoisovalerate dehydrogenase [Deltaproteobacteria bacterium RIFCSPLOWO2_02_FULL_55_12]OIJ72622.1 MAG: 2-oxoisovalerate dehydrogenase [Deltaproteobacteria bacterium GWC2_55_46]HBG47224.1 alpha-ketoacid dehydrogenase subunit beta [Deltaproteobacteria bacterium]HCY11968.1 alpha-ketoacid dehydrogenase subunit beta [Deltaproteobacteria bacterium]
MAKLNLVQAINQALSEEMERDSNVVIIGEDVGKDGGVFRVTQGLMDRFGPERVIDTPLSELGIIGSAVGLSAYGLKPVAEIQFMGFTYAGVEQLFSHASRIRSRSRGRFSCPMVVRAPYGIGIKPPELHSESTEAIFCQMPGLKVVVPSTPYSAKGLLLSAIRDPDPVLFLEASRLYRSVKSEVPEGEYSIPLGKASIYQEGADITVVSWGTMLHRAAEASEDFDCEIIDLQTLRPYDEEAVLQSVKKTGRLVIVHEAPRMAGFGAELAALVAEEAFEYLKAPVIRVTAPDAVIPMARLEDYYMPSQESIKKAYEKVMKY